jgi:diguanylate cyclase (GGDEF)-like protein
MKNILLILNFEEKAIDQIKPFLETKFSKLIISSYEDFLEKHLIDENFLEKIRINDFMIMFNEDSNKDKVKLEKIENYFIESNIFPKQIIIYTNKKNHEFEISKFEYIYELIQKPFNESLFNAKINSVLRKYFSLKRIKDNLEHLAVNTNYFLLSNNNPKRTLLIGGDLKNLKRLSNILDQENHDVQIAHFENIYQNFLKDYIYSFDLVILNDFDNIHHLIFIFNQIKAHEDLRDSMIIFLIKNTDAIFLADVINLGIDAYFFWPTKQTSSLINLINFEIKNKAYFDFLNSELQKVFEATAFDETTRVFSKKYLTNFLENHSENGILKKDLGFIFMDLDGFKKINDIHGHLMGDELLIEVSKILKKEFSGKIVTRFGGDEFIIVIEQRDLINNDDLEKMAYEIKRIIENKKFYLNKKLLDKISISVGFSIGKSGSNFERAIEIADQKLYKSKKNK